MKDNKRTMIMIALVVIGAGSLIAGFETVHRQQQQKLWMDSHCQLVKRDHLHAVDVYRCDDGIEYDLRMDRETIPPGIEAYRPIE